MRKFIIVAFCLIFICAIVSFVVDQVDTYKYSCVKNGQQRMVNTVDGLMVEDQLTCKDGRTKWSRQYN